MADSAEGQLNGEKAVKFMKTRGMDENGEQHNEDLLPNVPTGSPGKTEEMGRLQTEVFLQLTLKQFAMRETVKICR